MPRKVKPGPAILRVEGISDGVDRRLVDDFTGEMIPQPDARPPKIQSAQAVRDQYNRERLAEKRALLERVMPERMGRVRPRAKMVAPHISGKRVIGRLGDKAIYVTLPPWRRS